MKLVPPESMGQAEVWCRQSPVRGLIGAAIMCAFLMGAVIVVWQRGFPWLIWAGGAALAAFLMAWFLADALGKFSPANWLLKVDPDGVWINLRSYQNRHLPEAATVLQLPYDEIAFVRRHIDTWSEPTHPISTAGRHWKLESLELSLVSGETTKVTNAIAALRARRTGLTGTRQAVTVPSPGVVRIAWRGHGNDVVPRLSRVLDELSRHVKVAAPTRTDRPSWTELSEVELDELVAQLVQSGDDMAASQLLIRRRGCSSTEAHKIVEKHASRI